MFKIAVYLSMVNNRVIEYFVSPLYERFWKEGRWTIMYISALTGGILSWLAGLDLMSEAGIAMPYPAGGIVTAILVGCGANLLHEFEDWLKQK